MRRRNEYKKLNTQKQEKPPNDAKNSEKQVLRKRQQTSICTILLILISILFRRQILELLVIFYDEFIKNNVRPTHLQDAIVQFQTPGKLKWNFTYSPSGELPRLVVFDEVEFSKKSSLVKTWSSVSYDESISIHQVDSNTCFKGNLGGVSCLPSLIAAGFEKCSSTTLHSWLIHHPNLIVSYGLRKYFFNRIKSEDELNLQWIDYPKKVLPKTPGGNDGLGVYWTMDKNSGLTTNLKEIKYTSTLVPSARIVLLTRNPTARAYSQFLMYTSHTLSLFHKTCFFAKNTVTEDVEFIYQGGRPGTKVSPNISPTDDEWRFLKFPINPKDFDTWIRKQIQNQGKNLFDTSRKKRVLGEGLYSEYLKGIAQYFPPEQIIVIPKELFFTSNIYENMNDLQRVLGLPVFDYSKITKKNKKNGQYEIQSIREYFNRVFNTFSARSSPMLDSTKKILDEYYCEYNMELSRMLGGRALPGYSCAEDGVPPD